MKFDKNNSSLKILVTGGAGFIGSALVRHIIKNTNHSLVNIDKLTYAGSLTSLESIINKGTAKVKTDFLELTDPKMFEEKNEETINN